MAAALKIRVMSRGGQIRKRMKHSSGQQITGCVVHLLRPTTSAWAADALDDSFRVKYYQEYLAQAMAAVEQDGVRLKGYFAWSLLDNFGKW